MTSVVPQKTLTKTSRALAPATLRSACGLFFHLFRASQAASFQIQTQAISNAIALGLAPIKIQADIVQPLGNQIFISRIKYISIVQQKNRCPMHKVSFRDQSQPLQLQSVRDMRPRNHDSRFRQSKIGSRGPLQGAVGLGSPPWPKVELKNPCQRAPQCFNADLQRGKAPKHLDLFVVERRKHGFLDQADLLLNSLMRLPYSLSAAFFLPGFFTVSSAAFFAAALRLRISSFEYMVPRHFFAPQLQTASSSPPS